MVIMSGQSHPEQSDPKHAEIDPAAEEATDAQAQENTPPDGEASAAGASQEPITEAQLIAELETERLRQETEIGELKDQVLRAHAEMQNVRRRTEKEKADASKYAISKFAMDVVTIADNLQRAMDAAGKPTDLGEDVKGMYEGIALTAQDLEKTLAKNNVVRIPALGSLFDPHLHQAMMEQPDPSKPSGTILQVFQEGYRIGERVLRPSMVVVARGGPKPVKVAPTSGDEPDTNAGSDDPAPITPDDDPTQSTN